MAEDTRLECSCSRFLRPLRAKTEAVDGREKVTAGLFPLEFVRFMFEIDNAVVDSDRWGMPGLTLTVLTDPVDTFFLAKLLSELDAGCGKPGNGLGTISGKALIG